MDVVGPSGAATFTVRSTDGTPIAVWVEGEGPPLVLVHGSLRDHQVFDALIEHLRPQLRTFAMDRRGFGRSGDGARYRIEQEFADVAAVAEAAAARTHAQVALFGHSFGAGCAMGAAALAGGISRLVIYEPGLGIAYPEGWIAQNEAALAEGRADEVVEAVLADILGMSPEEIEERRAGPQWAAYAAAAHTVLREARVEDGWTYRPGMFGDMAARALVLVGTETPPPLMRATLRAAAAMPDARLHVLDGHGHLAILEDPALVANLVWRFVAA